MATPGVGLGVQDSKGFCLPSSAAVSAVAKEKVEMEVLHPRPPPRPDSEIAELEDPVPASLT